MDIRSIIRLVVACGVSLAAGLIGSFAVNGGGFAGWYSTIEKPFFTPPPLRPF
jgi:tryptophan-rich sensory protein